MVHACQARRRHHLLKCQLLSIRQHPGVWWALPKAAPCIAPTSMTRGRAIQPWALDLLGYRPAHSVLSPSHPSKQMRVVRRPWPVEEIGMYQPFSSAAWHRGWCCTGSPDVLLPHVSPRGVQSRLCRASIPRTEPPATGLDPTRRDHKQVPQHPPQTGSQSMNWPQCSSASAHQLWADEDRVLCDMGTWGTLLLCTDRKANGKLQKHPN